MPGPRQVRQQERHEQRLKQIREQVAQGSLVCSSISADGGTVRLTA